MADLTHLTWTCSKYQQKCQKDMRGHDSRILDDESKQVFIQFEQARAKRI